MARDGRRSSPPERPRELGERPGLLERAGCFVFVAMPLIFGWPIARAYAQLLGVWVLPGYLLAAALVIAFAIVVLEQEEE